MSLTINTKPNIYDNAASWNVTTSLTEGGSYQNLRLRANLYANGAVLASKVQRKGAPDFDFSDILRSLCKPFRVGLGWTNSLDTGYGVSIPSNKITGWTNDGGLPWDTFTSTGATVNSLINSGNIAKAYTNNFSVTAGKKYCLTWRALTVNSGIRPRIEFEVVSAWGNMYELEEDTDAEVFVFTADVNSAVANVQIWADAADSVNISTWELKCYEIPGAVDDAPMNAHYYILFSEMYENASDVTTTGDQDWSDSRMFFELIGTFDDYVCDGTTKKLLTRRNPNGNYYQNPNGTEYGELQIGFICKLNRIYFKLVVDGGAPSRVDRYNMAGYGVILLNNQSGYPAAGELWELTMEKTGAVEISETYQFRLTPRPYDSDKHIQLEWGNRYGGNESFIFLGGHSETTKAERTSYRNFTDRNRIAQAILFDRKKLFAPNTVPGEARAIGDLVQSKNVYLVDGNDRTEEVFVVNNSLNVYDRGDLIDIEITIEQ